MVRMTELGFVKNKNWVTPSLQAKSDECDGVTRRRVTPSPREIKKFRGLDAGQGPKRPCQH
jgi:hypothetical protein